MKHRVVLHTKNVLHLLMWMFIAIPLQAQFIDDFNANTIKLDSKGIDGWNYFSGDGSAVMKFDQTHERYASINVDATNDRLGIWWALVKRCVSMEMKLNLLSQPNYQLRIEARIRVSEAPKRVNLHLNTQRTTDFHFQLMEFDIPDTVNWHTISFTTTNFNAVAGDTVFGQLALMDWGFDRYRVDIDHFKVDMVNVDTVGPDKGVQVPYHLPVPNTDFFENQISVSQDAIINLEFPEVNFANWYTMDENSEIKLSTVGANQFVLLRWDIDKFKGKKVSGSGLLELTTYSVQRSSNYNKDFGMVRFSEIIGGEPNWDRDSVTYQNFSKGLSLNKIINSQMIIDEKVNEHKYGKNLITISNPVLQRLIDTKTFGLAIKPLGSVLASFFSTGNADKKLAAKLYFNMVKNK